MSDYAPTQHDLATNSIHVICPIQGCGFAWNAALMSPDVDALVERQVHDNIDIHLRSKHGLMSLVKAEYEKGEAIKAATQAGERHGREQYKESIRAVVRDAVQDAMRPDTAHPLDWDDI
jgi:hypothetical protein